MLLKPEGMGDYFHSVVDMENSLKQFETKEKENVNQG